MDLLITLVLPGCHGVPCSKEKSRLCGLQKMAVNYVVLLQLNHYILFLNSLLAVSEYKHVS